VRADIFDKAEQKNVDIGNTCNRALASAVGIDFDLREKEHSMARNPVIIAKDTAPAGLPLTIPTVQPSSGPAGHLHPVINADDPAAITSVKKARRTPAVQPAAATAVSAPLPAREPTESLPADSPGKTAKSKAGKSTQKKKGTGPDLKKFVADAILREDAENATITKEALYQEFARWCRERRIEKAPDRRALTVALKNQFALIEKIVDGEPSWVNVRLK
jgi:predicted component of type VI protein secretion system